MAGDPSDPDLMLAGFIAAMTGAGQNGLWRAVAAYSPFKDERLFPLHGVGAVVIVFLVVATAYLIRFRSEKRQLEHISHRYQNAINASLDAVVVTDITGRILEFNTGAERIFGHTRAAAIGADMATLILPEAYRPINKALMRTLIESGQTVLDSRGRMKIEGLRSNGEAFPAAASLGLSGPADDQIFTSYIRDITDQLKAQEDLTQARDDALAAARARSQFLAVMSHETRTPLNGVLAVLDLLAAGPLDEQQKNFVREGINSGELLQRHIDDLIQLNELENGAITFHPSTFSIGELVNEVITMNAAAATANGNLIVFDSPLSGTYILEDRRRLGQILVNLIRNAVKFTRGGRIQIEVDRVKGPEGEDLLEIIVSDNGAGIADADRDRIFDSFVTLDSIDRRTHRGSGLGLAICRRIARAMGGDIGVDSREDQYSRFWVRLPFHEALAAANSSGFQASAARPFELLTGRLGLNVLLVEDDQTSRLVAREMLSRLGCQVAEAVDGLEAVRAAADHRFDLILMDVNMPKMGGLEATQAIRGGMQSASRLTPIVGLTAHALPEEQERLRQSGMQECLIKPVRARNLQGLLRHFTDFQSECAGGNAPSDKIPASDPAVDHDTLAELASLLPPKLFHERLSAFRAEVYGMDASLRAMRADQDPQAIGRLAHRYAGAAAMFGATPLREHLAKIEMAALDDQRACVEDLLAPVGALVAATVAALDQRSADTRS